MSLRVSHTVREISLSPDPMFEKTWTEIKAIKAAERASKAQADARAFRAGVRNAFYLIVGMSLGLGALFLT